MKRPPGPRRKACRKGGDVPWWSRLRSTRSLAARRARRAASWWPAASARPRSTTPRRALATPSFSQARRPRQARWPRRPPSRAGRRALRPSPPSPAGPDRTISMLHPRPTSRGMRAQRPLKVATEGIGRSGRTAVLAPLHASTKHINGAGGQRYGAHARSNWPGSFLFTALLGPRH